MDEEETVIMKHSQLYSYVADFPSDNQDEAMKGEKQVLLEQLRESELVPSTSPSTVHNSFVEKFCVSFRRIFSLPSWAAAALVRIFSFWRLRISSKRFRLKLIQQILVSPLLDDDDAAALQAEYESLSRSGSESMQRLNHWCLRKIPLCFFAAAFGIVYGSIRYVFNEGGIYYAFDALTSLLIIATGVQLIDDRHCNQLFDLTRDIVQRSCEMDDLLRKALKVVREYEVLARGYTVVTKYTVIANRPIKDDCEQIVPCVQLRKCVFLAAEELFTQFRHWTIKINRSCEKTADDTYVQPFLLAEVEDLRAMFGGFSQRNDWKVSLSVLHACCYCVGLQRSEFLRVFVLRSPGGRPSLRILAHLVESTATWMERLRSALACYERKPDVPLPSTSPNGRPASDAPDPKYDYVHSLTLHLRLALDKSTECEKQLLDSMNQQTQSFDMQNCVDQLRSTLKKGQACLDELEQIMRASNRNDDTGKEACDSAVGNPLDQGQNSEEKQQLVYDGTSKEIVDQVFEAYTNTDDFPPPSVDNGPIYDAQFNSGRLHVLDELKNVLTIRSSIMRERELKAVAAKRGITVEELLAEEEADKHDRHSQESKSQEIDTQMENAGRKIEPVCNTLASELMRALQKRSQIKEVVVGDDSSGEEDEAD